MIPKNANEAEYTLAWIKDAECLFSEERIDSATVPEGFHKYDIRHTDNDWGQPCTVEQTVVANYYGSVLLHQQLDFGDKDYITKDQTRQGVSSSGKNAGEIDILIMSEKAPFSLIEAMKLSGLDQSTLTEHIRKVFTYDTLGCVVNRNEV